MLHLESAGQLPHYRASTGHLPVSSLTYRVPAEGDIVNQDIRLAFASLSWRHSLSSLQSKSVGISLQGSLGCP